MAWNSQPITIWVVCSVEWILWNYEIDRGSYFPGFFTCKKKWIRVISYYTYTYIYSILSELYRNWSLGARYVVSVDLPWRPYCSVVINSKAMINRCNFPARVFREKWLEFRNLYLPGVKFHSRLVFN